MKAYGGVHVEVQIFLTSALAGCEWSASCTGRFSPGESVTGTNWIGGWVTPEPFWMTWRKFLTPPGLRIYFVNIYWPGLAQEMEQ
jgi:hypothetical protein